MEVVRSWFVKHGDDVEVVAIDDIVTGDFKMALQGIEVFVIICMH